MTEPYRTKTGRVLSNADIDALVDEIESPTYASGLAETVTHRLRFDVGRAAVAAWEQEHGPLTADELAVAVTRARRLLGRPGRSTAADQPLAAEAAALEADEADRDEMLALAELMTRLRSR